MSKLPSDRQHAIVKASNEYDSAVIANEMTAFKKSRAVARQKASQD